MSRLLAQMVLRSLRGRAVQEGDDVVVRMAPRHALLLGTLAQAVLKNTTDTTRAREAPQSIQRKRRA